jgi:hypothetical protein
MKSSKTCVTTEGLKFCDIYGIDNYACGALNYFDKPAELKDLLRSCGANDICYYACGALNDSNKTCGTLRFINSLRS